MEKPVLFEAENHVAVITLNRPDARNAMNQALMQYLLDYIDEVSANDDIRAAIITGSGKSFCAGVDLKAFQKENIFDPRGDGKMLPEVMGACSKPVIGAINGHAITGGLEIALNCDFLIASERASFADTHAKVNIHPGWGMTQLLRQAVGIRMAKQMSFTCQFMDAQKALGSGLVNEVVPHEKLMERTRQIAAEITRTNPNMLQTVKRLMEYRDETTHTLACNNERDRFFEYVRELQGTLKNN